MGHVPHGPEHDADVPARGSAKALTARKIAGLVAFDLVAILLVAGLVALAVWQVHRRDWKLDLIARVEARAHAAPAPAPGPERWPAISAASDEYRRVVASGTWRQERPALVRAVTELGEGYWVMTPLARDDGTTILVNRGFVPAENRDPAAWQAPRSAGPFTVTGLLRMSEPGGGFLRSNEPAADRWYSRDVGAIAATHGMAEAAPYFIDAERVPGETGLPVAGLTVLSFSNNHLVYALTWAILAMMAAAGAIFVHIEVLWPGRLRTPREGPQIS
jgi:surfeit locus 1 family protein